jgi:hypothetical protein
VKPRPEFYSSPLSRFCAEQLPSDFHYLDGDEVLFRRSALPIIYARETGVLRFVESKNPGEDFTRAQTELFPVLADLIETGVKAGKLSIGSGMFVIRGDLHAPPVEIGQVRPGPRTVGIQYAASWSVGGEALARFLRCRWSPERNAS